MTTSLTLSPAAAEAARAVLAEREYQERMDSAGILMRAAAKAQDLDMAAYWLHVRAVLHARHDNAGELPS